METTCSKVNVIVIGTTVTALDEYVILAFFVSFLLTTITVILLVKYITYYMQQDRKRIQQNLETQHLPRQPKEEVEETDSEFDDVWSESEDVDIEVDEMQSVPSEETNQNLETNYIAVFSSHINLHDNNNKHQLLANLQKKNDIIAVPFIPNDSLAASLFTDLYFHERLKSTDFCDLFYNKLTESLWLRKSIILQHLNFILGLLCEMHHISQDNSMKLQGKYEQEIDENCLDLTVAIGNIVNSMTDNLNAIGCNINVKNLEKITNCFYSIHFDCLKYSALEFSSIGDFVGNFEFTKVECVMEIQCYHIQIKCRVLSLHKFINTDEANKSQITDIKDRYKEKVFTLLNELDVDFKSELQNMIWQVRKHRTDELDKLFSKHERDFSSLRYEIFKAKHKDIETKVKTFTQYIVLLHNEYIKDKNQVIIELNKFEELQIKMFYKKQYKSVISRITKLEEEVFLSLQETCNYTDEHILSITKNIQDYLKEMKQKCVVIKKQVMNRYNLIIEKWTEVITFIIECIIKAVSSEFRLIKDVFRTTLQQVPTFTEEIIENLLNSVQRRFSVIVFDIVVSLIEDIIKNIRQTHKMEGKQLVCNFLDLRNELMDNNRDNSTISIDQFNWLMLPAVNLNEFSVDKILCSYKSVIADILNDAVDTVIKEEIEPLQVSATLQHFNKQSDIYESIRDLTSAEKNKAEDVDKNKSKKYMSRKGSSYSAKTKTDLLHETYASLIGMKETKLQEISNIIENKRICNLEEKDKTTGIASCIAVLKKELSIGENDTENDYFMQLFKCEDEYMIRRFEKKIQLLLYDKQSDNNEDEIVRKKSKVPLIKSRNVVSPESSSSKQSKASRGKVKK